MDNPVATATPDAGLLVQLKTAARALGASGGGAGAAQLLALLCDPEVETDRVLACLRGDPALAARVLRVANSPFYHQAGQVGTVERAVHLLGLAAIRGIAAAGCIDRAAPPRAGQAFDPAVFRQHSMAVACAAQHMARRSGLANASEAFMAGLLHDIGLLLMAKALPAEMASFLPPEVQRPEEGLAAERRHFGVDHQACGGVLAQAWGLPAWLQLALTTHHLPSRPGLEAGGVQALLAAADAVAHRAGFALWPLCGWGRDAPVPAAIAGELLDDTLALLPDAVAALSASP